MPRKRNCGIFQAGHTASCSFFFHSTAQEQTQMSFFNCQSFEMYMLYCRNSQVWLDYSSNGRRNCSSHCSSGQSNTLLIDGNMTWFVIVQRKDPSTEKGKRPADYLLLTKAVGQNRILGYSQFSTIQTATLISCAVTVFNLALVLSW